MYTVLWRSMRKTESRGLDSDNGNPLFITQYSPLENILLKIAQQHWHILSSDTNPTWSSTHSHSHFSIYNGLTDKYYLFTHPHSSMRLDGIITHQNQKYDHSILGLGFTFSKQQWGLHEHRSRLITENCGCWWLQNVTRGRIQGSLVCLSWHRECA